MKPLLVIAPCSCVWDVGGPMPALRFMNVKCWHSWHTTRARPTACARFESALYANPSRAYDLARAGYAMAAQGVGRAKGGG